MIRSLLPAGLAAGVILVAACGDGATGPDVTPTPSVNCSTASTRTLAPGEFAVVDPLASGACVRIPAAGAGGAEHLYVALAAAGEVTSAGLDAPYGVTGDIPLTASRGRVPSPLLGAFRRTDRAATFHGSLRAWEHTLPRAGAPRAQLDRGAAAHTPPTPPAVGSKDTFNVCKTTSCTTYVNSVATAQVVTPRVAIYLDDSVPAGGYTQADLQSVGALFDDHLYPIDTTAFGRESDLDNNGVVVVLLTQRVNQLTPNCDDGSVILGYFFGLDLFPAADSAHSNKGEIFYGLVPDPNSSGCTISKDYATSNLPGVFIHEFQHMISFNQHVLVRDGDAEDTWLNEGLSHFAEELGGRQVPDNFCPDAPSCASEFLSGNIGNAFTYLDRPDTTYLIEPGNSGGNLAERGANWLFVRWLADHYAASQPLGTDLTRKLVQTDRLGAANVSAATGQPFPTLVTQWQLANYLDDLPGFNPSSSLLQYTSWNFRALYAANAGIFGKPYPLTPDTADGGTYSSSGRLKAGSGHHVLIQQSGNAAAAEFTLTNGAGALPSATIEPRIGLVRIR